MVQLSDSAAHSAGADGEGAQCAGRKTGRRSRSQMVAAACDGLSGPWRSFCCQMWLQVSQQPDGRHQLKAEMSGDGRREMWRVRPTHRVLCHRAPHVQIFVLETDLHRKAQSC